MAKAVSDLDLFFEDPKMRADRAGRVGIHPSIVGGKCREYGTLYKLRKESNACFKSKTASTPWAGVMCVLTGIDLLACFYAGSNVAGKVTPRLRSFTYDCMPPNCVQYRDQLVGLRNC